MSHSITHIAKQLSELGLTKGDLVMVHASLRKIGPVADRAQGVIQSLLNAIGESGTLVFPLGSRLGDIFDPHESCADPEIGVLAEEFRKYPGVMVNDHPAARFGAIGRASSELLANLPLHDYYSKESILDRFTSMKGKVLRLGANKDTTTLTHYAEYLAEVAPKKRVTRVYQTKSRGKLSIDSLDDCLGIQSWDGGDYFAQILEDFLSTASVKVGAVGNCQAELFEAKVFVPFAVKWMENNLTR